MKKILTVLVSLLMVLCLAGCGAKEEDTATTGGEAKDTYTIAFSLKTVTNDAFQQAIATAVENAAKAAGCEFQLVTVDSETDVAKQVTQIEDLITKGVDALVVNPMDANAVVPALKEAKEAGIPVVLVDSTIADGNDDLYVTYIGTDNAAAAKQGAEVLSEALGGTGKVLLVRGANGNSVGNARADGFKAGLAAGVELVGEEPGDWSNDVAKQVTENMLQANPDVTGIMSCSDVMVDGILQAIEDAGLADKGIKIMSFDGDSIPLIKEGKVLGTMAQFPDKMGSLAVETLMSILNGEKTADSFNKYTNSGTACYTADNLPN